MIKQGGRFRLRIKTQSIHVLAGFSFFERVPLYEIACIAALIVTRGASAQRLGFVMCMFSVLQLLPGVSAMDGAGAASASGSANGPSLWSAAGAFACQTCRHACHTNRAVRQHVRLHLNIGHSSRATKRQQQAQGDDSYVCEPGGGTGPRATRPRPVWQKGCLLLGSKFLRNH